LVTAGAFGPMTMKLLEDLHDLIRPLPEVTANRVSERFSTGLDTELGAIAANKLRTKDYVTLCSNFFNRRHYRGDIWIHRNRGNIGVDCSRLICAVSGFVCYFSDFQRKAISLIRWSPYTAF
jgi:hypothetical protein